MCKTVRKFVGVCFLTESACVSMSTSFGHSSNKSVFNICTRSSFNYIITQDLCGRGFGPDPVMKLSKFPQTSLVRTGNVENSTSLFLFPNPGQATVKYFQGVQTLRPYSVICFLHVGWKSCCLASGVFKYCPVYTQLYTN